MTKLLTALGWAGSLGIRIGMGRGMGMGREGSFFCFILGG